MPPHTGAPYPITHGLEHIDVIEQDDGLPKLVAPQAGPWQYQVIWPLVFLFVYMHLAAVYGLYLMLFNGTWSTIIFSFFMYLISAISITAGAHRLWTHRCYKATKPLQIFLMLGHSLAAQYNIFTWVIIHRLHHRYSDTDGDPHNATRGFIYSHIGWACVERHPELKKRARLIDMSDICANPIVMFQKRHYIWLNLIIGFFLPTLIPIYFWNESISLAYHVNALRIICFVITSSFVNSLAHTFGGQPYDKNISPKQNFFVNFFVFGEGFHNYHHTFPYDYRAGEFGSFMNFTTSFLDFCGKLGLAYDFKEASGEVVKQRMARTGDGSNDKYGLGDMLSLLKSL